ncbi:hypothetical protein Esti_002993 [Eimeria stiedai]
MTGVVRRKQQQHQQQQQEKQQRQQQQQQQQQQQAVAVFLPALHASASLVAAIGEVFFSCGSVAAVVTPESVQRRLLSRECLSPSAFVPPSPLHAAGLRVCEAGEEAEEEAETARDYLLQQGRRGNVWSPLEAHELLRQVVALQAACPSVCILGCRLPLVSLAERLAPRRCLFPRPSPPPQSCCPPPTAAAAVYEGRSRLVLVPVYRHLAEEEADDPDGFELGSRRTLPSAQNANPATAAAAEARAAAAAAALAAGASCVRGPWREIALEAGALRLLEPHARILVVFVGTRLALTTPQPRATEDLAQQQEETAGGDTGEETSSCADAPAAHLLGCAAAAAAAAADETAARKKRSKDNSSSSNNKSSRCGAGMRRRGPNLLAALDVLACELLLLWGVDVAYEANEETAAALLLRLARAAASARQVRVLPRGKLRRLAATAADEAAAAAAAHAGATGGEPLDGGSTSVGGPLSAEAGGFPSGQTDTLKRQWKAQLLQLPGVSEEVACAISAAYPSPSALFSRADAEAAEAAAAAGEGRSPSSSAMEGSSSKRRRRRGPTASERAPQLQAELAAVVVPGRCGKGRRVESERAPRVFVHLKRLPLKLTTASERQHRGRVEQQRLLLAALPLEETLVADVAGAGDGEGPLALFFRVSPLEASPDEAEGRNALTGELPLGP